MTAAIESRLAGESLRRLWNGLDQTQQSAVSEVLYDPDGEFHRERFEAKYGTLPAGFGPVGTLEASPLRLFLYPAGRYGAEPFGIPPDPGESPANIRSAAPPPAEATLAAEDELPQSVDIPRHAWLRKGETPTFDRVELVRRDMESAAPRDLQSVLRLVDRGRVAVSAKTRRASLTVFPDRRLCANTPLSPDERLALETWADAESDGVWRLGRERILTAVESGHDADDLRKFLVARDDQPLPETVEGFLRDAERGARALRTQGMALLIECADADIAARLAADARTAKLRLRAGERHLVVRTKSEAAFRKAVRTLDYGMPNAEWRMPESPAPARISSRRPESGEGHRRRSRRRLGVTTSRSPRLDFAALVALSPKPASGKVTSISFRSRSRLPERASPCPMTPRSGR